MNIVVVYTKEDLDSVWFEVAATLRGCHEIMRKPFILTPPYTENGKTITLNGKWNGSLLFQKYT